MLRQSLFSSYRCSRNRVWYSSLTIPAWKSCHLIRAGVLPCDVRGCLSTIPAPVCLCAEGILAERNQWEKGCWMIYSSLSFHSWKKIPEPVAEPALLCLQLAEIGQSCAKITGARTSCTKHKRLQSFQEAAVPHHGLFPSEWIHFSRDSFVHVHVITVCYHSAYLGLMNLPPAEQM